MASVEQMEEYIHNKMIEQVLSQANESIERYKVMAGFESLKDLQDLRSEMVVSFGEVSLSTADAKISWLGNEAKRKFNLAERIGKKTAGGMAYNKADNEVKSSDEMKKDYRDEILSHKNYLKMSATQSYLDHAISDLQQRISKFKEIL